MEQTFTLSVIFSENVDRIIEDHPEWWNEEDEYTGPEVPGEIYESGISLMGVANILGGISKPDQEFIEEFELTLE